MHSSLDGATAEGRARAKLGFFAHATSYALVMSALATINLITDRRSLWFVWPLLGWGAGLASHAVGVFALAEGGYLHQRLLRREVSRHASAVQH